MTAVGSVSRGYSAITAIGVPPRLTTRALDLAPTLAVGGDIRAMLHALKVSQRGEDAAKAEAGVAVGDVVRTEGAAKHREAQERAKSADADRDFWSKVASTASTVATVVAVAAAVASVVATGGASAVAIIALAGTLLSAGSPLVAKAAGEDAGKVALYGGMAVSIGATAYSAAGKTAVTVAARAAAAQTAKAALSPTAQSIAAGTAVGARSTEGVARVGQGYAQYREGKANANADEARADQVSARAVVRRSQTMVEQVVELLRDLDASTSRALQTAAKIGDAADATKNVLNRNVARRAV